MNFLNFFVADAHAMAPKTQQGGGGYEGIIMLVIMFAIFYFLLIRPQMKRAKEHKKLVSELATGDEVVTNGGLLGRITKVGESFVTIELADNVQVRVQRHAIASIMPKGTVKSA